MGCAVKAPKKDRRRKSLRKPRPAKVALEYPLPYDKLPPEVQRKAIESWQEDHYFPDWDEVEFLTETLQNDLEYEFGIDVAYRSAGKSHSGKDISEPKLFWDTYPLLVTFNANLDIDKVMSHGVPGCEYYSPLADDLRQCRQTIQMLDAVRMHDYDPEWSFEMGEKECEANYEIYDDTELTDEQATVYDRLAGQMSDVLKEIYDTACRQLAKILDDEIVYRNSDECIAENLEACDHWLFDEDGDLA